MDRDGGNASREERGKPQRRFMDAVMEDMQRRMLGQGETAAAEGRIHGENKAIRTFTAPLNLVTVVTGSESFTSLWRTFGPQWSLFEHEQPV